MTTTRNATYEPVGRGGRRAIQHNGIWYSLSACFHHGKGSDEWDCDIYRCSEKPCRGDHCPGGEIIWVLTHYSSIEGALAAGERHVQGLVDEDRPR